VAKSQDVLELVKQSVALEDKLNPERLKRNFLLLSLRAVVLNSSQTLGQGGWHSDGVQGCERIQMDGLKTSIDRAYTISSRLPTAVTDLRLNLDPHRRLAEKMNLTLDQFNMQDIIQKTVDQAESDARQLGKTIIKYAVPNTLQYLNPTMLHSAQPSITPPGEKLQRSFMRILFTEIPRDRLGDTVNPVFGPIYPMKMKQLTDIFEVPWGQSQFAYKHTDIPSPYGTAEQIIKARSMATLHENDFSGEDATDGSEDSSGEGIRTEASTEFSEIELNSAQLSVRHTKVFDPCGPV